jgi:pectin methylesterase-like acyl-CoA thioesterase
VLAQERAYFGNFDPFGDFDLIFGAAKQNLKSSKRRFTTRRAPSAKPRFRAFATAGCC